MAYAAAHEALAQALAIAEPEGYVRSFVDEGAPMRELLATTLVARQTRRDEASQRMAGYVSRLLAALAGKTLREGPAVPPSPALVEPLSTRELQVLRLLATDLSVPEIARELIMSTNTVRTHVKCIYGKLGAHGCIEAIQRAQLLGLLP